MSITLPYNKELEVSTVTQDLFILYSFTGATRSYFGSYTNVMMIFGGFYIAGACITLYDVPKIKNLISRKRCSS